MKIVIISDSHDNTSNLKKAVDIANTEQCKYLIHLGDIIAPFASKHLQEFHGEIHAVHGNCDG